MPRALHARFDETGTYPHEQLLVVKKKRELFLGV